MRDTSGVPIIGAKVVASFSECDSLQLCLPDGSEAYTFEPGRFVIAAPTGDAGRVTLWIRGGGNCSGGAAEIRVAGVVIGRRPVASPDRVGDLEAATCDCARICWAAVLFALGFPYDPSADLDLNWIVNAADVGVCCLHASCDSTACDSLGSLPKWRAAEGGHACVSALIVPDLPLEAFALHLPIPNPASREVAVRFDLPRAAEVRLTIHDVAGRIVRRALADQHRSPGRHDYVWDGLTDTGKRAMPGIYFLKLRAAGQVRGVRLVMLK